MKFIGLLESAFMNYRYLNCHLKQLMRLVTKNLLIYQTILLENLTVESNS